MRWFIGGLPVNRSAAVDAANLHPMASEATASTILSLKKHFAGKDLYPHQLLTAPTDYAYHNFYEHRHSHLTSGVVRSGRSSDSEAISCHYIAYLHRSITLADKVKLSAENGAECNSSSRARDIPTGD